MNKAYEFALAFGLGVLATLTGVRMWQHYDADDLCVKVMDTYQVDTPYQKVSARDDGIFTYDGAMPFQRPDGTFDYAQCVYCLGHWTTMPPWLLKPQRYIPHWQPWQPPPSYGDVIQLDSASKFVFQALDTPKDYFFMVRQR